MDGARLKEIRKDHGDTQKTLGEKLGFSTPTVSKWEQGETDPTLDCLVKICRMYQVSADYLLGLTNDDPFFTQRKPQVLSSESSAALKLFAEYLYDRDKKKTKP